MTLGRSSASARNRSSSPFIARSRSIRKRSRTHEFVPDFVIRLSGAGGPVHLVLETKGYDPLDEVKEAATRRWAAAVNADGKYGEWRFAMARRMEDVSYVLQEAAGR